MVVLICNERENVLSWAFYSHCKFLIAKKNFLKYFCSLVIFFLDLEFYKTDAFCPFCANIVFKPKSAKRLAMKLQNALSKMQNAEYAKTKSTSV